MKLTKLSHAQEALIPIVRDEWLNRMFSLPPLNKPRATEGIKWLYKFSGLEEPMVVFVSSPLGAQFAANLFGTEEVRAQVWDQVGAQVWAQVGDQVRAQVGDQVGDQVWAQVGDQVRAQVGAQVGDQVGDQVWAQVGDQVRAKYYDTSSYGNTSDFGWLAFYDFFQRIGLNLKCTGFEPFMDLMKSGIYDMIQLKGVCIVCEMPKVIHRDNLNRLHCTTGYAIEWADGYGVHALWGVRFMPELFNSIASRSIAPKDVLKIKNMEQRMAALRFLGAEVVLQAMDSRLMSTSKRGNALYEVSGLGESKQYCLKYSCPSTQRQYVSFVPLEVGVKGDPDACMAWKFELTKTEYDELAFES